MVDWFKQSPAAGAYRNIPPVEAEERYYARVAETAVAARDSNKIASGNPGAVQDAKHSKGIGPTSLLEVPDRLDVGGDCDSHSGPYRSIDSKAICEEQPPH